jgi:hypothetical protein
MTSASQSKPIFISHAVADKEIADAIVDLLCVSMGIDPKDVFCSSLEGLGIPPGKNFISFIKNQIQTPKIVFLLISQNYMCRDFCLAELGATWAMSHLAIPIIVPPVEFDNLKAVLTGLQAVKISSVDGWNEILPILEQQLDKKANVARWHVKRDKFLAAIPDLIARQPAPTTVSFEKYKKLEESQQAALKALSEEQDSHAELSKLYEKVKGAKDKDEVRKIEIENLDEDVLFEELTGKAAQKLNTMSRMVIEAFYQRQLGDELTWPDGFNDDGRASDMRDALERQWLCEGHHGGLIVNEAHPLVRESIKALDELDTFLSGISSSFVDWYESEYKETLDFSSRDFWERHFI